MEQDTLGPLGGRCTFRRSGHIVYSDSDYERHSALFTQEHRKTSYAHIAPWRARASLASKDCLQAGPADRQGNSQRQTAVDNRATQPSSRIPTYTINRVPRFEIRNLHGRKVRQFLFFNSYVLQIDSDCSINLLEWNLELNEEWFIEKCTPQKNVHHPERRNRILSIENSTL